MISSYLLAFSAALIAALAATPLARRVALKFGLLDRPGQRKGHADPTPYLGGIAIIVAFSAAVVTGAVIQGIRGSYFAIAAALGGALFLAAVGLWDDLRVVPGWLKVPIEIGAAGILFASGVRAQLFGLWPLDLLLTVVWVVGITNAVNYMDNMDGLTGGVSAIASIYFVFLGALSDQVLVAGLAAALAGCSIGFLWYNRPPARIFMGDSGSLFLGFLLATLGLDLQFDNIARVTFFVPVVVMAVPIIDTLMVTISRVRRGLSPIRPGRDHISHRLVLLGVPQRAAVGIMYFAALAAGWIGLVIAFSPPLTAYLLMGWVVVVGVFFLLMLLDLDQRLDRPNSPE